MRTTTIPLAAISLAVVLAGCGSSSKSATTNASTPTSAVSNSSLAANTSAAGAGLTLASSRYGKVIFDSHHRALYLFAADRGSTSTCYGECARVWPPLLAHGAPAAGSGLTSSLLGVTKRTDGTMQVTYAGHPLYYFNEDHGSGIACQGANSQGGFWYVVNADGSANKSHGEMMMHHSTHDHSMHHTSTASSSPGA
jgi:predicted lipoprotein with Yx(FWY)xxD motif